MSNVHEQSSLQLISLSETPSPKEASSPLELQLLQLRRNYLASLPVEIEQLSALATNLRPERLHELGQSLHKLAGSSGPLGQPALGAQARILEARVQHWIDHPTIPIGLDDAMRFADDVADLTYLLVDVDIASFPVKTVEAYSNHSRAQDIWLIETDAELGCELTSQLSSFNYSVRVFDSVESAEKESVNDSPEMLIVDIDLKVDHNSAPILDQCKKLSSLGCPMIIVSQQSDFDTRVNASRLGAEGYFVKPLDIPRLVARVEQLFANRNASPGRVLIIDDDIALAQHYKAFLNGTGMEAEVLSDPKTIIKTLKDFRPELVLMDLHMPEFSGPDLAGVIRQHECWSSLPIVYLSSERNIQRQITAMSRGCDDFLNKPVQDAQLVATIAARIDRARLFSEKISKDSLTGLLKHAAIKEAVNIEIKRAQRFQKPLVVAMIDIDHFKSVNDTYGHANGDLVIASVARLLRQRLRKSDLIGRYGGEEFLVALPECSAEEALVILDDIRQRFSQIKFTHEQAPFHCTFSSGLACYDQYEESADTLLSLADKALYVAKRNGRNQVRQIDPSGENFISMDPGSTLHCTFVPQGESSH